MANEVNSTFKVKSKGFEASYTVLEDAQKEYTERITKLKKKKQPYNISLSENGKVLVSAKATKREFEDDED